MGRPRLHDESTVARLTQAAEHLLATGGVAALSVRSVAEAAQATTRAVYSVFGSKEQLIRALLRRGLEHFLETTRAASRADDPYEDLLLLTVEGFRRFARQEPHFYRLIFERPLPGFAPSMEDRLILRTALGVLSERTGRIAAAGLSGGRDAQILAIEWTAVVQGLVSAELNGAPAEAGEEVVFIDVLRSLFQGWRTPMVRIAPPSG